MRHISYFNEFSEYEEKIGCGYTFVNNIKHSYIIFSDVQSEILM
jgi:hypothetical protein